MYLLALSVPAVARTPTTPVFVALAAGFTAGSIPINLTGNSSLSVAMAAAVAVLHATTMMSAPFSIRWRVIDLALSMIYSRVFSPYGQCALSDQ